MPKSMESQHPKVVIDLPFVCSYNINMKIKFAGFFRPDHDPPLIESPFRVSKTLFDI
jgi:hypothetical protein